MWELLSVSIKAGERVSERGDREREREREELKRGRQRGRRKRRKSAGYETESLINVPLTHLVNKDQHFY